VYDFYAYVIKTCANNLYRIATIHILSFGRYLPKPYKMATATPPPRLLSAEQKQYCTRLLALNHCHKLNANCLMVLLRSPPSCQYVPTIESAKAKILELSWSPCRSRNQMLRLIRASSFSSSSTPPTSSSSCKKETTATRVEITDRARTRLMIGTTRLLTFGPRNRPYGTPSYLSMWCICSRHRRGAQPHTRKGGKQYQFKSVY
jgi:hypothetical protein